MAESAAENVRYRLLRLGLACDAECLFCNVPAESHPGPARLSAEEAGREIERLAAEGVKRLELSGGEPALRPDLERLVARARAAGFERVQLQTNGIALARPGRADALRRAGLTDAFVALHSHRSRVHDGLARRTGAWDACVRAIAGLLAAGVRVVLNPVVTTIQQSELSAYMDFVARDLAGVESVSLSVVQPHGRAAAHPRLVPRYGELSPLVAEALDAADARGLRVVNPFCGLPLCVGGWSRRLERCVEWCESALGREPGGGMKVRPPSCAPCVLRARCGGAWPRYLEFHPDHGLSPLAAAGRTA
ncbi:MAG: radical SAM protein [Elusimicrobia bacterium]|nr:radical SAM protein [Elusimicrobiota bacterium]